MAKKASKKKVSRRTVKRRGPVSMITLPALAPGEKYRGIVLGADGKPDHHVVLLSCRLASGTHEEALDWAKKLGGVLPDRADGALLYANNADGAVENVWYWLEPLLAGYPGCAWCQGFSNGSQFWDSRDSHCRAVAVRRIPIR